MTRYRDMDIRSVPRGEEDALASRERLLQQQRTVSRHQVRGGGTETALEARDRLLHNQARHEPSARKKGRHHDRDEEQQERQVRRDTRRQPQQDPYCDETALESRERLLHGARAQSNMRIDPHEDALASRARLMAGQQTYAAAVIPNVQGDRDVDLSVGTRRPNGPSFT